MNLLTNPRITVGQMIDKVIYRDDKRFDEVEINFLIAIKQNYGDIPYIPLGSMDCELVKYLENWKNKNAQTT